jgi:hypothetical protein
MSLPRKNDEKKGGNDASKNNSLLSLFCIVAFNYVTAGLLPLFFHIGHWINVSLQHLGPVLLCWSTESTEYAKFLCNMWFLSCFAELVWALTIRRFWVTCGSNLALLE